MRFSPRGALGAVVAAAVVCGAATTASAQTLNLIGFDFSTAAAAAIPQNWNRVSTLSGVISNAMDETGAPSGVSMAFGPVTGDGFVYLSTSTLAADAVPQYDYDLSGMTGYGFRAGGELFVEFRGLVPNAPYEYWFVAYRGGSNIDNNVHVSDGDVMNATTFNQFILLADNDGRFLVNTTTADNTMHWNDLSFTTTSSSGGIVRIEFAGDTQTTVVGAVAIRLVPEPATLSLLAFGPLMMLRRRR